MVTGYLFESDSAKWFSKNVNSKWTSNESQATLLRPSELNQVIQDNNLEHLINAGTLQFHLQSM